MYTFTFAAEGAPATGRFNQRVASLAGWYIIVHLQCPLVVVGRAGGAGGAQHCNARPAPINVLPRRLAGAHIHRNRLQAPQWMRRLGQIASDLIGRAHNAASALALALAALASALGAARVIAAVSAPTGRRLLALAPA